MDDNRYTYTIEPPEDNPPPKKKRRLGLAALIVAGALFFSLLGGVAGSYITGLMNPSESGSDDPPVQSLSVDDPTGAPAPSDPGSQGTVDQLAAITNPSGKELTIPEVYNKCDSAVVAINTQSTGVNVFGQTVAQASAGSGFLISQDGYVVTNHHVISGATDITVMLNDGQEYAATVVGSDKTTDLAVLKIEGSGFTYLELGDSNRLVVGEQVIAIGNPLGELANSLSVGYISALARTVNIDGDPMIMLQTDASVSPGNSGGPLINLYGQVVGIVSAKSTGSGVEGLGFAIPMNTAIDIINALIDNGYVTGRPYLGVSVQEYSSNNMYNLTPGLYIMSVDSGSCAEKAGLKPGDRVISLGGNKIGSTSDLKAYKLTFRAGQTTQIVVMRDGQELTLDITFDEDTSSGDNTPQSSNPSDQYRNPWESILPWESGNGT